MPDVRLGTWNDTAALRARSRAAPGVLFVSFNGAGLLARRGIVVKAPPRSARILAALFCGRVLSRATLIELLFGADPDGGPDRADLAVEQALQAARLVAAALGIVIANDRGRGLRARLIDLEAEAA